MSSQDSSKHLISQESINLRRHLFKDRSEARLFLAGNPLCRKVQRSPDKAFYKPSRSAHVVEADGLEKLLFLPVNHGSNFDENDTKDLIHGNKVSTPHKQGLDSLSSEVNLDFSDSTFSDRLTRYATAHKRALEMSKFIREKFKYLEEKKNYGQKERSIAHELKECGSLLVFHQFYTINKIKLASMCSCKRHILCPLCAIRRAAKSVQVYLQRFEYLMAENPKINPFMVTFTIKDGADLRERFDHLQSSFRHYFTQRRKSISSSCKHLPNESNKALGGISSFEVKRGSGSKLWHPHCHAIWLCEQAPDASELAREWYLITGDSYIVDVRPFQNDKDVSAAFLEVFKYALKFSEIPVEDNWEAFEVLQRKRLVNSFGVFRGVVVPDQMTDEIQYDDLPYIEMVFKYLSGHYQQIPIYTRSDVMESTTVNSQPLGF